MTTMYIALDEDNIYTIPNDKIEEFRLVARIDKALLSALHAGTYVMSLYYEDRRKFDMVEDNAETEIGEAFSEGAKFLADVMIDVHGVSETIEEQRKTATIYRRLIVPRMIVKGHLPKEAFEDEGGDE